VNVCWQDQNYDVGGTKSTQGPPPILATKLPSNERALWVKASLALGFSMGQRSRTKKKGRPQLTARELHVVSAIVAGYTNQEIALRFSISEVELERRVHKLFDKLRVVNRLELVLCAIDRGLLDR
jgi:DNA-binding NarL/FixJ family response regulator